MPRRSPASDEPTSAPVPAKGGFRFTELGPLVATKPQEASVLLASYLQANGGNVSATGRALGTTYRTVARWIKTLADAGHDPREIRASS